MVSTKICYSNPFVTEAMAKRLSTKVFGLCYMPSSTKWRGNPALEAGDALRVIDRFGEVHTVLIMSQTINFGGGMNAQISCPGEIAEEAEAAMSTPTGQKIAAAIGQVDVDFKKYVAEVCKLTLQQANTYTDESIEEQISLALEGSY